MKIEYVEGNRPEITCINCMHRHESYCELDDHFIHYGDMWTQTCDQLMPDISLEKMESSVVVPDGREINELAK